MDSKTTYIYLPIDVPEGGEFDKVVSEKTYFVKYKRFAGDYNHSAHNIPYKPKDTIPCDYCEDGNILISNDYEHRHIKCPTCKGTGTKGTVVSVEVGTKVCEVCGGSRIKEKYSGILGMRQFEQCYQCKDTTYQWKVGVE